jgi:hypothetical protein
MTLVLGYQTPTGVTIHADTQISHGLGGPNNLVPGRLKALVLRPDFCVAYAGPADLALKYIRQIAPQLTESVSTPDIAAMFLEAHNSAGRAVDFLLAHRRSATLQKISHGALSEGTNRFWIGSAEAASAIDRLESNAPALPAQIPDMYRRTIVTGQAFSSLVNANAVDSVGGLPLTVRTFGTGFQYSCEAAAFCAPQTFPGPGTWTVKFGTVQQGGYTYSILAPTDVHVPLLAVYFVQGRLGYVYAPLQFDDAIPYEGVSHEGLVLRIRADFDVAVAGPKAE